MRAHYSNAPEATLALAAQRWFHNWEELIGGSSPFTRTGFLQFIGPHDTGKLRENVTMLAGLGVNTRLVGTDELESLAPQLWVDRAEVAAYEPDSGYADPAATVAGLVAAAQRGGATLREGITPRCAEHRASAATERWEPGADFGSHRPSSAALCGITKETPGICRIGTAMRYSPTLRESTAPLPRNEGLTDAAGRQWATDGR